MPATPVAATLFQAAMTSKRAGRLADAEASFRRVLSVDQYHAEALHMLGIVRHQQGDSSEAESLIRRALAIREDAFFLDNLGNLLWENGRLDEAVSAYQRTVVRKPDYVNGYFNLGRLLQIMGRVHEAEQAYRLALIYSPSHADILERLGVLLQEGKRSREAENAFRRALAIAPDLIDALMALGGLFKGEERLVEAEACFRRALIRNPSLPVGHFNLGVILEGQKRYQEAESCFRRTLILQPDLVQAHLSLGGRLHDAKRPHEAYASYRRALELDPANPDAHNNIGSELMVLRDAEQALASFYRALDMEPGHLSANLNLNLALRDTGQLDRALEHGPRMIALFPDNPDVHLSHAFTLLQAGDLKRGWLEYEYRWKVINHEPGRGFTQPMWLGDADLRSRTIVLYTEQGYGDALQFVRYTALLAERGATVYLLVPPQLKSLLKSCAGAADVFTDGDTLPAFDYHCPLLSLPLALDTRVETIPAAIPYLAAESDQIAYWRDRLGPKTRLRVGLTWAGDPRKNAVNANAINDAQRSIHFDQIRPLLDVDGIDFYCLQFGPDAWAQMSGNAQVIDYTAKISNFEGSAALIANLDLVISVDTSVVHLTGAIGKPVWMLNRFNTCWRWLMDREDSPWYPTIRIFRQSSLGDWDGVIDRVKQELARVARDGL